MSQLFENYEPYIKDNKGINTNYPAVFGGLVTLNGAVMASGTVSFGTLAQGTVQTLASAATVAFTPTSTVVQHTPSQSETINFGTAAGFTGVEVFLEVITSGTSSFTLTFGTNTKSQGTLATGTTSAKYFIVTFVSDGTNWVEVSRTTAE